MNSPQMLWRSIIGGPSGVRQVLVTPPHEDDDRSEEFAARVGEPVLVALGIPGVGHPLEQTHVDEHPQPR